jgi:hypothetical protein
LFSNGIFKILILYIYDMMKVQSNNVSKDFFGGCQETSLGAIT